MFSVKGSGIADADSSEGASLRQNWGKIQFLNQEFPHFFRLPRFITFRSQ